MNLKYLFYFLVTICCSCNGEKTKNSIPTYPVHSEVGALMVNNKKSETKDSLPNSQSQYLLWVQEQNIPEECLFIKDQGFNIVFRLNPFYLRGDFNGDNFSDVAILIERKKDKKLGILITHAKSKDYYILGAGNSFGNGGDDFFWLNIWTVMCCKNESIVALSDNLSLEGEGIIVTKAEASSGLIYWKKGRYEWAQLGD
jgi:hypothetical protein